MTLLYEPAITYEDTYTYYGVGNGVQPVLKVEVDLSSSFPTEIFDIDYGGVLAYETSSEYNPEDRYDGFVVFDDITSYVRDIEITRGKSSLTYDHYDAGTCSISLVDFNSTFLPDEPNSPYYPNIKPLRQVRVSADWSGETFTLFRGFIDDWQIRWEPQREYAEVVIQATDAMKLLANFDTEYQGTDGDTPSARVLAMLQDKGWPADFTDIDLGLAPFNLVQDTSDRRPFLPNIQEYEFASHSGFFVSAEGKVTWRSIGLAYPYEGETPDYVFADSPGTNKVPIIELDYSVSDQQVYNVVSITPTLGTEQVQTDGTSIDEYRERALVRTDVPLDSDSWANLLALYLIVEQSLPAARITSVTTDPRLTIASTKAGLASDILTTIDFERTPPGGTSSTYKMYVIGVRHTITPEEWRTELLTNFRVGSDYDAIVGP